MTRNILILAACGLAAACATSDAGEGDPAVADLRDAAGRAMGRATAMQAGGDIRVTLDGADMPAGIKGAHVHQVGTCTAPGFESAGPHWNPTGAQHGKDNPAGMHAGDLPNVTVGANGQGRIEYLIRGARLAGGMLDADGAAFVIHAAADDHRTDPSGNSGARIACGVFR